MIEIESTIVGREVRRRRRMKRSRRKMREGWGEGGGGGGGEGRRRDKRGVAASGPNGPPDSVGGKKNRGMLLKQTTARTAIPEDASISVWGETCSGRGKWPAWRNCEANFPELRLLFLGPYGSREYRARGQEGYRPPPPLPPACGEERKKKKERTGGDVGQVCCSCFCFCFCFCLCLLSRISPPVHTPTHSNAHSQISPFLECPLCQAPLASRCRVPGQVARITELFCLGGVSLSLE